MEFVKARHFTDTGTAGRRIDLGVLHVMVIPETSSAAEACARMFATTTREASAHYCIDDDSIVQGVRDLDIAWAAPGANHDGLQFEQAGTLQSVRQWRDNYSTRMLELSARLMAEKCSEFDIPARWLTAPELVDNRRGITDHWEVTKAFHQSTHTDCGVTFREIVPDYIDNVRNIMKDLGKDPDSGPAEKPELPTVRPGDVGWLVKKVQRRLIVHGYMHKDDRDGIFGPATRAAVVKFQRANGLPQDGIVGRRTWRALRAT